MKREFLENLKIGDQALGKDLIDTIMAENGRDIESAKKPFVKAGRVEQMHEVGYRFDIPYEGRRREKPWKELASIDSTGAVYTEYDERGGKVPYVVGMGLKDALFVLESRGLKVRFSGAGAVTQQSIPAGARITPGSTVGITLK